MKKNGKMDRDKDKKKILRRWSTMDGPTIARVVKWFGHKHIYKEKEVKKDTSYEDALKIFR